MNTHLLQTKLTPAAYQTLLPKWHPEMVPAKTYSQSLPTYLLARCPICQGRYMARLDTYSLFHWSTASTGECVFDCNYQNTGCRHFVGVHHFINLNGFKKPDEYRVLPIAPEVPHVIPKLLVSEGDPAHHKQASSFVDSVAVIHALPICQIENNRFVPRYSLYTITYYSRNATVMQRALGEVRNLPGGIIALHDLVLVAEEQWWDLPYWVERHLLWWLDPNDSNLPLRHGAVDLFPYGNIRGSRERYPKRK